LEVSQVNHPPSRERKRPEQVALAAILALSLSALAAPASEIHDAAARGDVRTLKRLLAEDPKLVGTTDKEGRTPLHCAAERGSVDACRALVDSGAALNARDDNGETPLHYAVRDRWRPGVGLLIAGGADPQIPDLWGRTPLNFARAGHIARGSYIRWPNIIRIPDKGIIAILERAEARQRLARIESQFTLAATCALACAGILGLGFAVIAVKMVQERRRLQT
jgi:hypothetical protein